MACREVVRKEGFCEQRAAQGAGTDIRLRPNQSYRAGRERPVWDPEKGKSKGSRNRRFTSSENDCYEAKVTTKRGFLAAGIQEAQQPIANDRVGLCHNPRDQIGDSRDVVD